ncbi:MAG: TolC family outer membrane protein [Pseudomonadota bacterium]
MSAKHAPALVVRAACAFLMGSSLGAVCTGQTLMDVYRKAQDQDAQYTIARKTFDASLEKLPQARAGFLPTLNLTGNKNIQSGEASFSDAPYIQREPNNWSWTLQLTQPLLRWGNWASYRQADAQVRQAQEQMALAEQDLILRTAQSYFDVLLAAESLRVLDAQLKAVDEQWALAKRNFEVGTGTITDAHEAHAKYALNLAQRVAAVNELASKQADLERMLGEPMALTPVRVAQTLPSIDTEGMDAWRNAAAANNPQIKVQQAALTVAQQEVSKSNGAHMPTLDFVLSRSANYNSGTLSSPADLQSQVNTRQVGLQLTMPLFAGGATQSRVREALALQEKATAELALAQRNAENQVRQAFAGVTNGLAQVEALQVAVLAGNNAVEGNKIGFKIGTRIIPDVLNAEQQLFAAMRDLSKARVETINQGLKLKAAAGLLQTTDLAALQLLMEPLR